MSRQMHDGAILISSTVENRSGSQMAMPPSAWLAPPHETSKYIASPGPYPDEHPGKPRIAFVDRAPRWTVQRSMKEA
jgi:hypothetical protein